ncbi:MAG TPA: hypothetical protein PKE04_18765, partial [Clostridia bacterium]|nr:hypothetical protein [Clostridia bacterium]
AQAAGMYYIIYLAIVLFISTLVRISDGSSGSLGGMEMSTTIFLFVMGLVTFRETFNMMLQNGVSRRTLFVSRTLAIAILCVCMGAIDMTVTEISRAFAGTDARMSVYSFYDLAYPQALAAMNGFGRWMTSWALMATQSIMVMCLGYGITLAYYRMNRFAKWVVSFGVPILLSLVLTRINIQALGRFLSAILGIGRQLPPIAMLTFLVAAAIFSGCSWLLLRRAPVR